MGTKNTTGQSYRGHFSPWVVNSLQERLLYLDNILEKPMEIKGWVNGNLYIQTKERLGIVPLPADIRKLVGMADFNPLSDRKPQHGYLAKMQGTRKAILPVHTAAEIALFHRLMEKNEAFNSRVSGPRWSDAVKVWNEEADKSDDIFYKASYFNILFSTLLTHQQAAYRTA